MEHVQNSKQYDLEERTAIFAGNCRDFTKTLPKITHNKDLIEETIQLRRIFTSIIEKSSSGLGN